MRPLFQKIIASQLPQGHATHKYDDAGNQIEMTRDSGPRGRDTRLTRFNEHGDMIRQESDSVTRHMDFDREGAEIPESAKAHTQHTVVRYEYTYDSHGNWIEQTQWISMERDQKEFTSMRVKRTLTYF